MPLAQTSLQMAQAEVWTGIATKRNNASCESSFASACAQIETHLAANTERGDYEERPLDLWEFAGGFMRIALCTNAWGVPLQCTVWLTGNEVTF